MEAVHLGDGAYVKEGSFKGEIILYTSNGVEERNHVVLDPTAIRSLVAWLGKLQHEINRPRRAGRPPSGPNPWSSSGSEG